MKNVLFVASECVPFVKTGGLADVVGSLPKYFDKNEFDVRVMVPKYACIPEEWKNKMNYVTHFYIDLAWRKQYVGIMEMEYEGVKFYFIDNEFYFAGFQPYGNRKVCLFLQSIFVRTAEFKFPSGYYSLP